jgi:transcriptional regulator GlxA family with amidase domain
VEKAIALMRAALDARWTVSRLARAVGLSRPAFARRFVISQGMSPLRYAFKRFYLRSPGAFRRTLRSSITTPMLRAA